jgi:hypothetical protein
MMSKGDARYIADIIFEVGERREYNDGFSCWYHTAINTYIGLTEGRKSLKDVLSWLKAWNADLHGDDDLEELIEYLHEEYFEEEDDDNEVD